MEAHVFFFTIVVVLTVLSYVLEPKVSRLLSWTVNQQIKFVETQCLRRPNLLERLQALPILAPVYASRFPLLRYIADRIILKGLIRWSQQVNFEEELKDITPFQHAVAQWLAFETHFWNEPYYMDLFQAGYFFNLDQLKERAPVQISDRDLIDIIAHRLEKVGFLTEYIKHAVSKGISLTADQISFIIKIYSIYFYRRAHKGAFLAS